MAARKRKAGVRRKCYKHKSKTICVCINNRTGKFAKCPRKGKARKRKATKRRR